MIQLFFDGSCRPRNPGGHARGGAIILYGDTIKKISKCVGTGDGMSCNVAEYAALNNALEWLIYKKLNDSKIEIFGDSLLVIRQMNHFIESDFKSDPRFSGLYSPYAKSCLSLIEKFTDISFNWIPREQNEDADALSRCHIEFVREPRRAGLSV